MADVDILGVSAHLDFNDIQKSIDQLINGLDKIGIKTDVLSKRMNDAMNEIARSSEDTATKNKKAMDVFTQGIAEAKLALEKYPETLRQAKNEEEATALATARLEEQLKKLNAEFLNSNVGSEKYEKLKTSIAGVEQQINANNLVHEKQLQTIQEMEAGYSQLVSMYGVGSAAIGTNAIAHTTVAVATGTEAAAHLDNAEKIEKETEATKENTKEKKQLTAAQKEAITALQPFQREIASINQELAKDGDIQKAIQRYDELIAKVQELYNAENAKTTNFIGEHGERRDEWNEYITSADYTEAQQKALLYSNTLNELRSAKAKLASTSEEVSVAQKEENQSTQIASSSFKEQWNNVNELHDKIQSLTKELRDYESEYEKLSEKPGFDPQSKKAQELTEKINNLKKEISDTKKEMSEESGVGSFLAKWKNIVVDAATGNGKFQESLGNMKNALGGLAAPFTAATTGAMNFVKSLWAMAATPIGAVISVIVLGFKAIHTWMTKSAEGQRVYTKITAYLGSLLSSLTDIAVKIGKYLYHAFADPQGALNQFGKGLVGMVINPLKMAAKTLSGVGKIAGGVIEAITSRSPKTWAEAMDKMKAGWEDLKKAGSSAIDTFKSGWDTVAGAAKGAVKLIGEGISQGWTSDLGEIGSDMLGRAQKAAQLAEQELNAQKAISEAKVKEKELDIEIAREREKIYTLTGKAKDEQIELVKNKLKEKYDGQIAAQKELLRITKERNNLHTKSLESFAKEREAQGAVYTLEAQRAASTRMLVRMQQANLKSMANADKKDARKEQQIEDAETNYNEIMRKNALAYAKAVQDMEQKIADARIEAMEEGSEKFIAAKERELEKELHQLDEQRKAAVEAERARQKAEFQAQEKIIKARGGKTEQWDDSKVDNAPINTINKQYDELRRLTVEKQINEEKEAQINAMNEYLKKYGSFQAQKSAITREYDKKIEKAQETAQKAALKAERERLISELNLKELTQNIEWDTIFNNLDRATTEVLQKLREKLRAQLENGNVSPEDAAVLSERLLTIENKIAEKTNFWASLIPPLQERVRLTNQVLDAERKIASFKNDQTKKEKELFELLTSISGQTEGALRQRFGSEIQSGDITSVADALGIKEGSEEWQKLQVAMENYRSSLIKTTTAQENLATLTSMMKKGGKGVFSGIGEILSNTAESAGGGVAGWMSVINNNAQSMAEFVDKIGIGESEFGKSVHDFADGVGGFNKAIQSLLSGDIFGAINGIIDGVVGIGNALGRPFGLGGADYSDYDKAKARYDELSKIWDELISKKRQYLSESWGLEAEKAGEEALKLLRTEQEYNRILAQERLDSGSSTGSHSIWYRMWKGSYTSDGADNLGKLNNGRWASSAGDINWQDVNKAIEQGLRSAGLGNTSFRNMSDMLNMTGEQLEWIKTNYTGLWAAMDGEFRDALENIIKFGETEKEILDSLREQITGTSFDNVFNSFMSNMYNMADGAKDVEKQIANDWQQIMNKMILNNLMGEKYKEKLKAWYEKWYAAYNDDNNLTAAEIANLRNEYNTIVKEAADEVKALREQGLIKQTNGNDQQSTYNSLEKWSYEQADDLINRATALQIIDENQYQVLSQSLEVAYSTLSGVEGIRASVQEIASAIAVTIELQESANGKLDKIIANTNPIGEIRDLVKKLYNER